jgi:hypothetical protein
MNKRATENYILKFLTVSSPTFQNDAHLHISFALLYSLLQKRLLTCTLLKLCLTQVLFNKRPILVPPFYLHELLLIVNTDLEMKI